MPSSVATMMPPRSPGACLVTVRTYAERERFLQRRAQLEQQHAAQVSAGLALSAARERGLRVERDRQDSQEAEREVTRLVRRNGPRHPPPPLPGQADGEGGDGDAVASAASAPAPPPPPPAAALPPPSAATAVALTAGPKVLAKPPLPAASAVATTTNGVLHRVNGASNDATRVGGLPPPPSPAGTPNGVHFSHKANGVDGAQAAAGPGVVSNGISQARLKPVQLLPQPPQPPQPPNMVQLQQQRLTHRTPSPAPYCPTPDYDSDSSGSTLHTADKGRAPAPPAPPAASAASAAPEVEMQSLDSLELLEPRARQPRPPQTYFQQNRSSPAAGRPSVCVTIREYGGGAGSRQPSKLTFLNGGQQNGGGCPGPAQAGPQHQQQHQDSGHGTHGPHGLQSELAATLSRSNLRTRTETGLDAAREALAQEAEEALKVEDVSRGNVTITSVNGGTLTTPYMPKGTMPNGILKKGPAAHMASNGLPVGHGITPAILAGAGAALKAKSSGISTKTISFGAKATIINEKQVST